MWRKIMYTRLPIGPPASPRIAGYCTPLTFDSGDLSPRPPRWRRPWQGAVQVPCSSARSGAEITFGRGAGARHNRDQPMLSPNPVFSPISDHLFLSHSSFQRKNESIWTFETKKWGISSQSEECTYVCTFVAVSNEGLSAKWGAEPMKGIFTKKMCLSISFSFVILNP